MKRGLSLRKRIILIFLLVMILIVGIFYFMNNVFWNVVYMKANQKELKTTCEQLTLMLADEKTKISDIRNYLEDVKTTRNIAFALQGDEDWEFMVITREMLSPFERDFLRERLQANLIQSDTTGIKILEKTESYVLQKVELSDNGARYLECYGYMTNADGEEKSFILSIPLENIYQASTRSKAFVVVICVILFLLGAFLIYIITLKITKPVLKLSAISKKMARLDFSERYNGQGSDEIADLGNSINEMASQIERNFIMLNMANDRLKEDLKEKEQVDEMRKDFISNVSHELKTPIALIQGYAEGLKEVMDDPESCEYYIDVISDEADKMNRLVKKLSTLNQLEFGKDEADIKPFDIVEMIRGIISNSKKLQEEKQAEVSFTGPESAEILGDEFKIEEVINNYYSNALSHLSLPNKISFAVFDIGPLFRIEVHNTGENIPEDELDKIWIKFYKVDKARTRAYGGSGIGLSIVKAIMNQHGTECGGYNTKDGVTFWFELKKAQEPGELFEEKNEDEINKDGSVIDGEIVRTVEQTQVSVGSIKE